MMKAIVLAATGAAVALTSIPADARHTSRVCVKHRHGHCVAYRTASVQRWRTGYVFGPRYSYTTYTAIPRTYRVRYHLSPDYRYVYNNGYIYVVDPTTYAITRILTAL